MLSRTLVWVAPLIAIAACSSDVTSTPCNDASDCPALSEPCQVATCVLGQCEIENSGPSAPAPAAWQTDGDCEVLMCSGDGDAQPKIDNTDGDCGECSAAVDCPQPAECMAAVCVENTCGEIAAVDGSEPTGGQTPGDCQRDVCTDGAVASVADDADLPPSLGICSSPICTAGTPGHVALTGDDCGGGDVCNAVGECATCPGFFGVVDNVPSVWSADGEIGLQAGNAMCEAIGADHVCTYQEVLAAEAAGELAWIPNDTTVWLHRIASAQGLPAGPGGRCNDWTYPGGPLANGEWGEVTDGALTAHLDSDVTYDGMSGHWEPGLECMGETRAVMCCFPAGCTP